MFMTQKCPYRILGSGKWIEIDCQVSDYVKLLKNTNIKIKHIVLFFPCTAFIVKGITL